MTALLVSFATVACGPARSAVAPTATAPEKRGPRELVFRETRVGKIVKPRRSTWTLALSDATAELEVVEETAPESSANTAVYAWPKERSARYDGVLEHAVVILRCRTPGSERTLDFGASPGIESYDQNDDCAGQFHTLRRIAG